MAAPIPAPPPVTTTTCCRSVALLFAAKIFPFNVGPTSANGSVGALLELQAGEVAARRQSRSNFWYAKKSP
jgi:hypothetical protein